jgi:hypothetical protein
MKPFIFFVLIIYSASSFAQRTDPGRMTSSVGSFNAGSLTGGNDEFTYGKGIDVNSPRYTEVSGSPFLNQNYKPAYVAFKNGRKYMNVLVKFDILHNEIDIETNEGLISLLDIDSVSYPDSNYQNMILKTGFPSINKHDTSSFYQLVAQNNKIQLLKYYHCHISTIRSVGLPDRSSFDIDCQYYLFNKATKIIKEIKLNKKSFSSAITEMGYSKTEIDKNNNIDFKNEKEVAALVSSVNF